MTAEVVELLSDDEVFHDGDDDDEKSEASSYVSNVSEKQSSVVERKTRYGHTPSRQAGNG